MTTGREGGKGSPLFQHTERHILIIICRGGTESVICKSQVSLKSMKCRVKSKSRDHVGNKCFHFSKQIPIYTSDRHKATFSWQWVWHATRVRGWNWSSDVAVMSYAHSASGELQLELFFFAENSCLVLLETMCVRMEKQNNELKDAKSWGNAEGNLVNINSLWELKTTLLKIPLTLQVAIWSTLKQRY